MRSGLISQHSHFISDIDQALALFNELRDQDPYRIDNMDTFSNLLYVKVSRQLVMWSLIDWHRCLFSVVAQGSLSMSVRMIKCTEQEH